MMMTTMIMIIITNSSLISRVKKQKQNNNNNNNNNKSAKSNLEEGHITVLSHTRTLQSPHWLQWCAPNSPPKVPLPVDQSPNPTTCLIPGPVQPTMPNGIQIRSTIFPQCTGQTDRPADGPTYRSFAGKFDDYRPLRSESDAA